MSEGKLVRLAKKNEKKKQENRQRYRSSLLSIACFGHFRFCLVYLYCVYGKVVCHRARRLERKNRLSREERKRKETERVRKREKKNGEREKGEKDRSKIAKERWRSRGHSGERNGRKKAHFRGEFIGWRHSPPPYCEEKHMFRSDRISRSPIFLAYTHGRSFPFRRLRLQCNDCVL